ncbi:MAG: hypothetical protein FWB72_06150 [Firmicutes bacterium]|nr:hypothetical protein [Bacillota bacterium]
MLNTINFSATNGQYPLQIPLILLLSIITAVFVIACITQTVFAIKQHKRMRNSIVLLKLRSFRVIYFVLCGFFVGAIIALVTVAATTDIVAEFLLLAVICFALIIRLLTLGISPNAIVSDGIFTKGRFFHWHQLYDYFIEKDYNRIVFSINEKGFFTLAGTNFPLSFSKEDQDKVEYIFNLNKSKFSKFSEVRSDEL